MRKHVTNLFFVLLLGLWFFLLVSLAFIQNCYRKLIKTNALIILEVNECLWQKVGFAFDQISCDTFSILIQLVLKRQFMLCSACCQKCCDAVIRVATVTHPKTAELVALFMGINNGWGLSRSVPVVFCHRVTTSGLACHVIFTAVQKFIPET